MRIIISVALILFGCMAGIAQTKTVAQIKADIEKSTNSPLYVKDVLKKKFSIDTIPILRTSHFRGLPDSLAYHGKIGKVYGPYEKGKILVQILGKAPNTFNRIGQVFLDTSVFRRRFADSLADAIIRRIQAGTTTFEDMAQTYSMGGESATKGDIGWVAAGSMIPQIERELVKRKKGDIFKVWTVNGVHIIRKTDVKQDNGFALMMRIFL
jgi:PPIC-type PPIASE domain